MAGKSLQWPPLIAGFQVGRLIGGDSLLTRSFTVSEGEAAGASGDRSHQSGRPEGLEGTSLIIGADDQRSLLPSDGLAESQAVS